MAGTAAGHTGGLRPPILVADLELTEPIGDIGPQLASDGTRYTGARLLARMQTMPVGYASLGQDAFDARSVAREVWRQIGGAVNARRREHGLLPVTDLPLSGLAAEPALDKPLAEHPMVSVVVCTRDRPVSLMRTLSGLARLRYNRFEVIVVDNAPATDEARAAVLDGYGHDGLVRYIREPRPGLSCARNRGVADSHGEIVAFTDDDVVVDEWWLHGLVRGFGRAAHVGCVTGMARTAALDNNTQLYFDKRQAWGVSCEPRVFDLADNRDASPLYPYSAGIFGAGANFAMTQLALKDVGGFNEALGAGTMSGGGEDLEMFMRTVLAGYRLVYEASAVVSHAHRTELAELARQMHNYGSGCTAALTAMVMRSGRARRELPAKILRGGARIFAIGERTEDDQALPSGLVRREFAGLVHGPWLYLRARQRLRRSTVGGDVTAAASP